MPLDKLGFGHVRSDIAFSGKGFKRRNSFKWPLEKYFALDECKEGRGEAGPLPCYSRGWLLAA